MVVSVPLIILFYERMSGEIQLENGKFGENREVI